MDDASRVLTQGVPAGMPTSYRALADHSGVPRSTLHHRARGRRSIEEKAQSQQYLTPYEEDALVTFLLQMSDLGQPVRIKHIPSLAFVIARKRLGTHRPLKPPGKNWSQGFEKRHSELQARRAKALDWNRHGKNVYWKIAHWFEVIGRVLQDPTILAENLYNMDETGVMLSMPGSVKVLTGRDGKRNSRGARVKRTMVTAIECISADGRYLNPMIIWPAATHRSNWTTFSTPRWQYACSESGYTDSYISLQWLKCIFDPETRERANSKPRVLICDGFGTHKTLEILEYYFANNILLCRLASHTSHKTQPCDVSVFAPLKAAYREQVERLERGGVNTIGKEHFTFLYSRAREEAFTPRNIKAGFAASDLLPFNPDRVLRDMPKPPAELTIAKADEERITIRPEDEAVRTPVTPISVKGLASLQDLIIKQDANALNELSKQRLQRRLHKFSKAAQLSFATGALQQNQIRFLMTINNEAKVRRSTKSLVLGTARVMSYEDLETARRKRAADEATKKSKGKGKRGRKRKSDAPEGDALEPRVEVTQMNSMPQQPGEIPINGNETANDAWRAPVAQMW